MAEGGQDGGKILNTSFMYKNNVQSRERNKTQV